MAGYSALIEKSLSVKLMGTVLTNQVFFGLLCPGKARIINCSSGGLQRSATQGTWLPWIQVIKMDSYAYEDKRAVQPFQGDN
ncbi:MAG TPA: hypothetical protein VJ869_08720 [Sphaerochaeta sp.]|nr:hypothetical protein [Sphaerochaeta sp.]